MAILQQLQARMSHWGEICDANWTRADKTSLAFHEDSDIISMLSPDYFGIRVLYLVNRYSKFSATGISGSSIDAVAVVFALFASLLFSEIWVKHTKNNELVV